jgi:DNA polymerase-3 subunit beta
VSITEREPESVAVATVERPERTQGGMRIVCEQEPLRRGLGIVGRAVGGRTTLPVLNNVLLASDGGRLRLTATNLELGITTWIPAQVASEGAVTVPARLLTDFVNSLPGGQPVTLEVNGRTHSLSLVSGRYRATIKGIDAEEFPPVPVATERPTVQLQAGLLKELISQVAFAAARDESRPVLTGVNLHLEGTALTLAAADGFRLSRREATLDAGPPEPVDVIVPARSLSELARLLGDAEATVTLTITPNRTQVLFRVYGAAEEDEEGEARKAAPAGEVDVVTRLLEGQFPDLQRVIPKTYTTRVVIKRGEFMTATKIAALFARDAANVVRLELTPGDDGGLALGKVAISAVAAEVGENHGELDAQVEGEPTHISFSSEFLSEVLGVLSTDEISLKITGPMSPALVEGVGLPEFLHVIMPMHSVR